MRKFIASTIYIFSFFSIFCQNPTWNKVDSLLTESFNEFTKFQFIESVLLADSALQLATSNNYSTGKIISNIYIVKVLVEIGLDMEALRHLQNLTGESQLKNRIDYQVEIHRLKGKIYGNQKLYALARNEFDKQLLLSTQIEDERERELSKLWSYQNIEHLYALQKMPDSVKIYQTLQEKQLKKFREEEATYNISILYTNRAKYYLNKGQIEEAKRNLIKSNDLLEKYNIPYKYSNLELWGDLEAYKENADKALSYYNKALSNSKQLGIATASRNIHKKIMDYLLENNLNIDTAKYHHNEYTLLNDSLNNHNKLMAESVYELLLADNTHSFTSRIKSFRVISISLLSISILVAFILIIRNLKNKEKLVEKVYQLNSTEQKIESLQVALESNTFKEVVELAKTNSPEFLPLFIKYKPELLETFKMLAPDIRNTEISFLALAYLNFSTKEIANYTFVTTRAVQIRKNRLRKKYNIPSDIDFNIWVQETVNST